MDDLAITCHENIEPYDEKAKAVPTNFNEKKNSTTYYSIIDSCYYLLLFDKISSKTKTFITISRHK